MFAISKAGNKLRGKKSLAELFSTRRSTVLNHPFQRDFPGFGWCDALTFWKDRYNSTHDISWLIGVRPTQQRSGEWEKERRSKI